MYHLSPNVDVHHHLQMSSTSKSSEPGGNANTTPQNPTSTWSTPSHSRLRPTSAIYSPAKAQANESTIFYNSGCDKPTVGVSEAEDLSPITPNHTTFQVPESPVSRPITGPLKKTPPTSGLENTQSWDSPTEICFGEDSEFAHRSPASIFSATIGHNRGLSDSVWVSHHQLINLPCKQTFLSNTSQHPPTNTRIMYDAYEIARPRSRSGPPVSPDPSNDAVDENLFGVTIKSQYGNPSGQNTYLAAPSAQRRIYHSMQNQADQIGYEQKSSRPNDMVSGRLPTIYDEGRSTPGGIKLPVSQYHGPDPFVTNNKQSSGSGVATSQNLQHVMTNTAGPSSGGMTVQSVDDIASGVSRGSGGSNAAATNYGTDNGSGTTTHRDSEGSSVGPLVPPTPVTPLEQGKKTRTAKEWAQFIMNGGYDTPPNSQPSTSMYQTPSATPGPSISYPNHKAPAHKPFVLTQTVPYMNQPDPLIKSFIEQGRPVLHVLAQHLPFEATMNGRMPSTAGVLKIVDVSDSISQ